VPHESRTTLIAAAVRHLAIRQIEELRDQLGGCLRESELADERFELLGCLSELLCVRGDLLS
jgi:hypothetical protein